MDQTQTQLQPGVEDGGAPTEVVAGIELIIKKLKIPKKKEDPDASYTVQDDGRTKQEKKTRKSKKRRKEKIPKKRRAPSTRERGQP